MTNLYEIRKWGNGSSQYEVSYAVDYNVISQRAIYTTLGQVNKEGNAWVGIMTGVRFVNTPMITGKTRKEVIEKMTAIYNEPQVTELPKCMMCGNTNAEEIGEIELFSNEDGEDTVETQIICHEDMGCNDPQVECHGCGKVGRKSHMKVINGWNDCPECQEYHDVKNEVDEEYTHSEIVQSNRSSMWLADVYCKGEFYAQYSYSRKKDLENRLKKDLSKLNAGESL